MSRKAAASIPWWAEEEPQEPQDAKSKAKHNDDGAEVSLGDSRDASEPGGNGTGLYYCGRDLGEDAIPNSDGMCGPYGGPQCFSCKRFQVQQESRYDVGCDLQNLFNQPGANTRVLQDRVKGKVQQILAGRDLSDTTIGMLRSSLEEKLGLPADSLQSTKRLRKWVCQVLEQEVLKKQQRSNKCDRICCALADMETYPENCRRMLIEALPSAMAHPEGLSSGGETPHPHQVRLLETVQTALQESLDHFQAKSDAIDIRVQTEQSKLNELEEAREVATTSIAEQKAAFATQEDIVCIAQEACETAKADVQSSKKVQQEAIASRESLLQERDTFASNHATFLQLLEDDDEIEGRQQKLEDVRQCLQVLGTEPSLITAAHAALTNAKSARSSFDLISAMAVGRAFTEHAAKFEANIERNAAELEDGPIEIAEVLSDAILTNAASKLLALSDMRESLSKKESVLRATRKEAKQQSQALSSCQAECDTLKAKTTELVEVLDSVRQLILCTDAPSPAPPPRGASAALADEPEEKPESLAAEEPESQAVEATEAIEDVKCDLNEAFNSETVAATTEELFTEAFASENATATTEASAEPPSKKPKLDHEVKEDLNEATADVAMADESPAESTPLKEVQSPASLEQLISGGA